MVVQHLVMSLGDFRAQVPINPRGKLYDLLKLVPLTQGLQVTRTIHSTRSRLDRIVLLSTLTLVAVRIV